MYLIALVIETELDGIAQMVQDRGFATRFLMDPLRGGHVFVKD